MRFVQANHGYFDGDNHPRWIVIHSMEYPKRVGAAAWCANYFAGPDAPSAHYCVDPGEIIQSVRDQDGAWHTPGYAAGYEVNRNSIGIEHAGYAHFSREEWLDPDGISELTLSAGLVAELADKFGIPVKLLTVDEIRAGEPGIAGHNAFTIATGSGSHTDPGSDFPWGWYLSRVSAGGSPARQLAKGILIAGLASAVIWSAFSLAGTGSRKPLSA